MKDEPGGDGSKVFGGGILFISRKARKFRPSVLCTCCLPDPDSIQPTLEKYSTAGAALRFSARSFWHAARFNKRNSPNFKFMTLGNGSANRVADLFGFVLRLPAVSNLLNDHQLFLTI